MAAEIPTIEPTQIRAGDTVKWTRELADYPTSEAWALKYRIVGNGAEPREVTATIASGKYNITLGSTLTDDLAEGTYQLVGWVEKSGERFTVYNRTLSVLPNLAAAAGATDTRSHARKTLALIEAAIESHAVDPVESLTIGSRTYTRPSLETLYNLRSRYAALVRKEENKERIESGGKAKKLVVSFPSV